ncbi:Glutamate receptor ionotropic, kainate 2 [Nymphon striatum]|nr:Glutamate receptor ionotropic, kainate 2 [Nymphon striatum]
MVREVYKNQHQFQTVDALRETIFTKWSSSDLLGTLSSSMPERIFEVINEGGGATHYLIATLWAPNDPRVSTSEFAVSFINNLTDILPHTTLELLPKTTDGSAFGVLHAGCKAIKDGPVAVIGPRTTAQTRASQIVIGNFNIPQFSPTATDPHLSLVPRVNRAFPTLMKMSPPDNIMVHALTDLIRHFGWISISLLGESSEYGINALSSLLKVAVHYGWIIPAFEKFPIPLQGQKVEVLDQLYRIKAAGSQVVILHCLGRYGRDVLEQAQKFGMLEEKWTWIVTDGILVDNGINIRDENNEIPDHLTGILGLYSMHPSNNLLGNVKDKYRKKYNNDLEYTSKTFNAFLLLANALHSVIQQNQSFKAPAAGSLDCENKPNSKWVYGTLLLDKIYEQKINGLGGELKMNKYGFTNQYEYAILNVIKSEIRKIGFWEGPVTGNGKITLQKAPLFFGNTNDIPKGTQFNLRGKHIRIVVKLEKPFIMLNTDESQSPTKYIGLCIDFLEKLSEILKFEYSIEESLEYGSYHYESGTWNGMMEMLLANKSDLALAAFTISHARQNVITFTSPFFDTGLTLLVKKNMIVHNTWFFLSPFSPQVWGLIIGSLFLSGLAITVCSRLSPNGYMIWKKGSRDGHHHDHICPYSPIHDVKIFGIVEGIWFGYAALMQQGIDIGKTQIATRLVVTVWWMCCLVFLVMYTAKLSSIMTIQRMDSAIETIDDLLAHPDASFGTIKHTSVEAFFQQSKVYPYKRMHSIMQMRDSYVHNAEEGLKLVRSYSKSSIKDICIIYDSVILDYIALQEPCDTITVGRLFGMSHYGLGLQKNSYIAKYFSLTILKLREEGYFDYLKTKWFTGSCSKADKDGGISQVHLEDLFGLLYTLAVAVGLAVLFILLQWIHHFIKNKQNKVQNTRKDMSQSLKRKPGRPSHESTALLVIKYLQPHLAKLDEIQPLRTDVAHLRNEVNQLRAENSLFRTETTDLRSKVSNMEKVMNNLIIDIIRKDRIERNNSLIVFGARSDKPPDELKKEIQNILSLPETTEFEVIPLGKNPSPKKKTIKVTFEKISFEEKGNILKQDIRLKTEGKNVKIDFDRSPDDSKIIPIEPSNVL